VRRVSTVTREIFREKKLLAITFSGLLLLTGCSTASTDPEQAVKLLEYEKCLEYQQSLIDRINEDFQSALGTNEQEIIGIFQGQRERMKILFETSLKNCLPYRP
jgi:hypothetical protein